jgi:hypothetical protein
MPGELFNRTADNWRPLFAIADVIGRGWPERLRDIAINAALVEAGEDLSIGTRLLRDIHEIFGERDWVTTYDLLIALRSREWEIGSGKRLAKMLKPYGIEPKQERRGQNVERGYLASSFTDAFSRYIGVPVVPDVPVAPDAQEEKPLSFQAEAAVTNGTTGTFRRRF